MNDSDRLRSLLQQARREMRRYQRAVIEADSVDAFQPELPTTLYELDDEITKLSIPPELKTEIEKYHREVRSTQKTIALLSEGQRKQTSVDFETAREELAQKSKRLHEAEQHAKEFGEKWLSERKLDKASLTEEQKAEFDEATWDEFARWISAVN